MNEWMNEWLITAWHSRDKTRCIEAALAISRCSINSELGRRVETMRSVQGRRYQLLGRVGLALMLKTQESSKEKKKDNWTLVRFCLTFSIGSPDCTPPKWVAVGGVGKPGVSIQGACGSCSVGVDEKGGCELSCFDYGGLCEQGGLGFGVGGRGGWGERVSQYVTWLWVRGSYSICRKSLCWYS
jgi:hypothetical protein